MTDDDGLHDPAARAGEAPTEPDGAASGCVNPEGLAAPSAQAAHGGRAGPYLSLAMARLRTGQLEPGHVEQELLSHLAAHCPDCRRQIGQMRRLMGEAGHWNAEVAVTEWPPCPQAVGRAATRNCASA